MCFVLVKAIFPYCYLYARFDAKSEAALRLSLREYESTNEYQPKQQTQKLGLEKNCPTGYTT